MRKFSGKLTKIVSTWEGLGDCEVNSLQVLRWESDGCAAIGYGADLIDLEPEDKGQINSSIGSNKGQNGALTRRPRNHPMLRHCWELWPKQDASIEGEKFAARRIESTRHINVCNLYCKQCQSLHQL
jgi:hypothetical protein